MLKHKKFTYFFLEAFFFLKLFFVGFIFCAPQYVNQNFSQRVVASVTLSNQSKEYKLIKKVSPKQISYFLQIKALTRTLASEAKWKTRASQILLGQKPDINQQSIFELTNKQFSQYFLEIKNLVWTLKYKYPDFELKKCTKPIAQLKIDQSTHLDICIARPQGLARLSLLLKKWSNL